MGTVGNSFLKLLVLYLCLGFLVNFVFSSEEEDDYDYDLDDEYGHYYDDHDDHEEQKVEKKSENMKNDMREFFGITKSFRSSKKREKSGEADAHIHDCICADQS